MLIETDYMDSIKILKSVCMGKLANSDALEAENSDLTAYFEKLNHFEAQIALNEERNEQLIDDIHSLVEEAKKYISKEDLIGLKRETWEENLPKALYFQNVPFQLPRGEGGWNTPEQLTFNIRGPSYLDDREKIMSEAPLFQLRGIQVFRTEEFYTEVARLPWSAFPKHYQLNEWLITNYMMPGPFNVQIICYYTAVDVVRQVLRDEGIEDKNESTKEGNLNVNGDATPYGEENNGSVDELTKLPPTDDDISAEDNKLQLKSNDLSAEMSCKSDISQSNYEAINSGMTSAVPDEVLNEFDALGTENGEFSKELMPQNESAENGSAKGSRPSAPRCKSGSSSSVPARPREEGWKKLLKRFWKADEEYCNSRFKIIPQFVDAPWAVKAAVGVVPVLTGTKIKQTYYRGPNFFEVDIDMSSSSVAVGILRLVRGFSRKVVIDIGITIQGEADDELPERILCQTRFEKLDFNPMLEL